MKVIQFAATQTTDDSDAEMQAAYTAFGSVITDPGQRTDDKAKIESVVTVLVKFFVKQNLQISTTVE